MANLEKLTARQNRWLELLFCAALALLLSHELDAIAQAEWRLLPGLNSLGDSLGYELFVLLHVPFIAFIIWLLMSPLPAIRWRAQQVLDGFMLVHVGLHWLLADHSLNSFHSPLSQLLIFGAGLLALMHLTLGSLLGRRNTVRQSDDR